MSELLGVPDSEHPARGNRSPITMRPLRLRFRLSVGSLPDLELLVP